MFIDRHFVDEPCFSPRGPGGRRAAAPGAAAAAAVARAGGGPPTRVVIDVAAEVVQAVIATRATIITWIMDMIMIIIIITIMIMIHKLMVIIIIILQIMRFQLIVVTMSMMIPITLSRACRRPAAPSGAMPPSWAIRGRTSSTHLEHAIRSAQVKLVIKYDIDLHY